MKGRLVAFGCSNTYGQGLKDCWVPETRKFGPNSSEFAWPVLLAPKLNLECVNLSYPGASNKFIWNEIVNTVFRPTDTVIVLWTYPERWCVFDTEPDMNHIGPWENTKQSKCFYSKLYSEKDANIDMNIRINHSKLYLDNIGIKNYHLVYSREDFNQLSWNNTLVLKTYFGVYANQCPKALDGEHPGLIAHQMYANQIYKEITGMI